MNELFSVAAIREIEARARATLPPGELMARAGRAAAELARQLAGGREGRIVALAGPGNNGGDALEAAANLAALGHDVTVIHLPGGAAQSPERQLAFERARQFAVDFTDGLPHAPALVIDGLFGIGLTRALAGRARTLAMALAGLSCPVLALDVPSGLDADTGAFVGPDGVAVRATHTITFLGDKPGLHTNEGRAHAGAVTVDMLGIDIALPEPVAHLNGVEEFVHCLRARSDNAHKGSFGNVAIVGGAAGMAGAPLLGARAALFTGAGRVFAVFAGDTPAFDPVQPEIMCRSAGSFDYASATLVLGPGLGNSPDAVRIVLRALEVNGALVIDADALNLIAASADLQERLAARGNAILTPHPLEAARLLGMTAAIVQADRLAAAHELARRFSATVVLKGSGTVIADGGTLVVNGTGNPGLATAGTGDVLAGMCGSLLAQGWPRREVALAAVWMHGLAADRLVSQGFGPIGLTAGELPGAARALLNALVERYGRPQA